jgi:predicted nucleotidyltransferase
MDDPLQTTLFDAVELLQSRGINYALIGGLAATLRGQPRVTADVDLVIAADVDAALAILGSIERTKFAPLFDRAEEVVQAAFILPLRHRQTGVKLDLSLGLSGFETQLIARAGQVDLGPVSVAVAQAEDLIVMKTLAGRPRDDQDVQGIMVVHAADLDWDYCLRVAAELGEALDQNLVGRIRQLRDSIRP